MSTYAPLFKHFFSFRFISVTGIIIGLWLCSMQSEQTPLSSLLTEGRIYMISLIVVIGFHILLWLIVEKGSFYNIRGFLMRIIRDLILINVVVLSTVASCFLVSTFLL